MDHAIARISRIQITLTHISLAPASASCEIAAMLRGNHLDPAWKHWDEVLLAGA
jgi:hypothetical protein